MEKFSLISLGCDKNLVDSEIFLAYMEKQGYVFTDNEEEADLIIINTCCFILDAKQESIDTILRVAQYKSSGSLKKLIVCGCLGERYKDEIKKEIPEVDEVIGVDELENRLYHNGEIDRVLSGSGHSAYLKIADGCNKFCTYCIIPHIRGKYRSYPMEYLVKQAEKLAEGGVKELILVAQETTLYGTDLYNKKCLPELLKRLCGIDGIKWIRILYAYPEEITDELIETMASQEKICHYIDMPIQHASDRILRRMGRKTDKKDIVTIVGKLRKAMPDIAIRTTLISGFPGETEEDHRILVDFVKEMHFERLGVFAYSREEGTPAYDYDDQVPEEVKEARRDEIMSIQQEISSEFLSGMTENVLDVMIEGRLPDDGVLVGRTYMDAPDIDGYIFVNEKKRHESGDFIKAEVTDASEYDLMGDEL